MKTLVELKQFYEAELLSILEILEQKRKKILRKIIILGIVLLSILLAVVERLEQNFERKKGSTKDTKTPLA